MLATLCVALAVAAPVPEKKPVLSLTIALDKKEYKRGGPVKLTFEIKNVGVKELWIGDAFGAPEYTHVGLGQHFQLDVRDEDETRFHFWHTMPLEGQAASTRTVFRLKPGE